MKPSHVTAAIKTLYKAKRPPLIRGRAGVGKSETIRQSAIDLGVDMIDWRAVYREAVDLRGVPSVKNGKTYYNQPAELPTTGRGFFFLDELTSAPQQTQAACYQLVLEGRIGEYVLPEGWLVIGAGNLEDDKGITHRMPAPLVSRFVDILYEVDLNDWCKWAAMNGVRPEVIAFIRFRSVLLHNFDPKAKVAPFANPRSWVFVSQIMDQSPIPEIEHELFEGTVGPAALEFTGFLKVYRTLPSPDGILLNPKTAEVPTDPATLYALTTALSRRSTEANFDRVIDYAMRLDGEYSTVLVSDATARLPALTSTPGFIKWASVHGTNI